MIILAAGGDGQLGRALARRGCIALGHAALDVTRADSVEHALREQRPDVVINAAAYTAVDKAETDRDAAFAVNRDGAANLAAACARHDLPFLHVSTDYVFDGAADTPYHEDHPVRPIGVYGASKAAGEAAVRAHHEGAVIVRTSWVFARDGANFVKTMLRLGRERPVLRVVADQHGCPTFADDLADALLRLAELRIAGKTLHFCDDGATTWHAFATEIIAAAGLPAKVEAITTADYPTAAQRPAYSVLDTSRIRALGIVPPSWRAGMQAVVGS